MGLLRNLFLLVLVGPSAGFTTYGPQGTHKTHSKVVRRTAVCPVRMSEPQGSPPGYTGPRNTPLLDRVQSPEDLKGMTINQLKQLSHELRWDTINQVSNTGGHLSSSLGVVELTVALHHVFSCPEDPICFDVSHQVYPHKILTGRRDRMPTLRQQGGLSGFQKRAESEYDAFGAGHSSTSISAALGMSVARGLQRRRNNCVAIIGDGAITGGMAYEAMNQAAYLGSRVIVILNDNGQVSLPTGTPTAGGVEPVGSLSKYTTRLIASKQFQNLREVAKSLSQLFPQEIQDVNAKIDEYARGLVSGGTLFEELGFAYIGVVDGHDLDNLVPILTNIRDRESNKPIMLHIKTNKGQGYSPALAAADTMHGVAKFDVATGQQFKNPGGPPSYTSIFANTLIGIAEKDKSVVAITAAMPGGTGIDMFGRRFPKRTFDVGIAEQHAVTFAAGLAVEGIKPYCCIYSTFMQRGYDQIIHDVALQNLPVRFILDRAGLVGNDGATHHGTFDLAYLGCIPEIVIMAPSDELELMNMLQTAQSIDDKPSVVRYPRGAAYGIEKLNAMQGLGLEEMPREGLVLPIGKGRVVKQHRTTGGEQKVALLSIGTRLSVALKAAQTLEEQNPDLSVTCVDARYMKPLDTDLVRQLAADNDVLVTLEEGSIGGFGDHVLHFLALDGGLDSGKCKVRPMVIPDIWIEQATQSEQYETAGLAEHHVRGTVLKLLERQSVLQPQ